MFWLDFLFVLAIVLLIASVFGLGGSRYATGLDLVGFFLLLFFAWALGGWFRPFGPALWGVFWLPYVVAALLIGLLLMAAVAASGARPAPRTPTEAREEAEADHAVAATFGVFFWFFLVGTLVAIVANYALAA
mgnify:CR=1 FL=1